MGRQPCPVNLPSYSGGSECVVDAGVKSITVGRKSRHRYLFECSVGMSALSYVLRSMPSCRLCEMGSDRSSRKDGRRVNVMQGGVDVPCISRNWRIPHMACVD